MKQPWWRRALSYFTNVTIEATSSDYNEVLDLLLVKGRYQLCTDQAIYSFADLYDNFSTVFDKINIRELPIENVLVLGFGLGSIPYMLETTYGRKYQYTGVEIDDEVVYLASKYVLDELQSDIELITADAYAFVALNDTKYDMICLDIFIDDKVPEDFEDLEFLEMLKSTLSKNGILIYNRLAHNPLEESNTKAFLENTFKQVFPEANYLEKDGNWMLLNRLV